MRLFVADDHYKAYPGRCQYECIRDSYPDMIFRENDWNAFTEFDLAKDCRLLILNMIADTCGLPIPDEVERIDLALAFGVPTFMQTLKVVAEDMKVEKIILAEEIKTQNPEVLRQVEELFAGAEIEVEFVSHTELKEKTWDCKAVIRTGEITPYANIILQSGCIFA